MNAYYHVLAYNCSSLLFVRQLRRLTPRTSNRNMTKYSPGLVRSRRITVAEICEALSLVSQCILCRVGHASIFSYPTWPNPTRRWTRPLSNSDCVR